MLKGAPTLELGERVIYYDPLRVFFIVLLWVGLAGLFYWFANIQFEPAPWRNPRELGRLEFAGQLAWFGFVFAAGCLSIILFRLLRILGGKVPAFRLSPIGFQDCRWRDPMFSWSEITDVELTAGRHGKFLYVHITDVAVENLKSKKGLIGRYLRMLGGLSSLQRLNVNHVGTTITQDRLHDLLKQYLRAYGRCDSVRYEAVSQ